MPDPSRPVALVTGAAGGMGGAIAVAMLASGALSYSTGQTIHVDGGMRFKTF